MSIPRGVIMDKTILPAGLKQEVTLLCQEGFAVGGREGFKTQTITCTDLDLWDTDGLLACSGE